MNGMVTALMGKAHDEAKLQFRLRVFTALSFAAVLIIGITFAVLYGRVQALRQYKEVEVIAANQSSALEGRLSHSLSSTYALAALLRNSGGSIPNFEALASEMLQIYGGISSLQLAQGGIVSQVVPFVGNSQAIGRNLLENPEQRTGAQLAIDTRRLTLTGPYDLVQGGQAVIGRLAVFLPDPDSKDRFWGLSSAVIKIPELISMSGLNQLEQAGYQYELANILPDSGKYHVFSRSGTKSLADPVVRTIEVPNGKWILSIAPTEGWLETQLSWWALAGVLLLATLAAAFTYSAFRQPILLRREVADRTQELAYANRSLSDEIEERKRAQEAEEHINRLYSVLSHTNAAIMRITDRNKLLEEICNVAVELGEFPLARIAILDSGTQTWQWIAQRGQGGSLPDCDHLIRTCLAEKLGSHEGAILQSYSTDNDNPYSGPNCQLALAAGFHSHVFLQLRVRGKPVGVFSLYAREPNAFDAAQLRVLEEMAEDVSFALENMEREAERKKTEDNLRKLSRAVEQSASAVFITDRNGVIEYVNPWFCRITGYTPEEVIGKTPSILKSGETHPETHKRMRDTLLSGKEWTGELHNKKKNGETYWCLEVISPLKDDNGEITHFVAVTEDISERKQTEQTIRHLAFHDPLTGLPNRRLFTDRLHQAAASRHRSGNTFALMLFDIDRFKTINDTLGHDIGDALLKAVAARLLASTRQGDTLAHMGGDEFALIALEISQPEDVAYMAEKLLTILQEPFLLFGHELLITASIGITLFPNDAPNAEALVKNADIALYRAKDLGRNNFQFFTGDMNTAMMERLRLENAMRWAIERGEFMLHYQPQVNVQSRRIHGAEALIRWKHPELGMVSPAQFIPLAEETGMIVEIGEWVLRTACAQAKAWQVAGMPTRVAVNLSARQFHHGDLADVIAGILEEIDLGPELLEVELTEGILMEDTSQTAAILEKLHTMGVQISIDDFGTGYSSLSYLKRLPIDILKIDQSFVRDIHTDPDDRAIVNAVIALAHSLKLKVVAEGVETNEQLDFLREHACDLVQGYLFSRPITGDAVLALMQANTLLEA